MANLVTLLDELTSYEFEKEWFEFKSNMKSSHEIGEYISALSNSAASIGKKQGYLIWGIEDEWDVVLQEPFHMSVCELRRITLGFTGDGFDTHLVNISGGLGAQNHAEF